VQLSARELADAVDEATSANTTPAAYPVTFIAIRDLQLTIRETYDAFQSSFFARAENVKIFWPSRSVARIEADIPLP
jgi:hypothetical protein